MTTQIKNIFNTIGMYYSRQPPFIYIGGQINFFLFLSFFHKNENVFYLITAFLKWIKNTHYNS